MEDQIRIGIIDSDDVYRLGLEAALAHDERLSVQWSTAFQHLPDDNADLILIDPLPDEGGLLQDPRVAVRSIVLTQSFEMDVALPILTRGVRGFILKRNVEPKTLADIIHVLGWSRITAWDECIQELTKHYSLPKATNTAIGGLSPREVEVLALSAAGLFDAEIAARLGSKRSTVQNQIRSAVQKMGARNRPQAVLLAERNSMLIPIGDREIATDSQANSL